MADKPAKNAPAAKAAPKDTDPRHEARAEDEARQRAVEEAVSRAGLPPSPPDVRERSASWRITDPVTTVRSVASDSREIEGIAVPYGQVALDVEGGPEAFAPGALASSIEHWNSRQDGARMAYRPAHKEKPVGTVTALADTPDGVRFRASIFDSPAGDEYLAQVRSGLNGVSAEFAPGRSTRMRDGTVLHRDARLHAIAGSVSPAYDGARIALRDMEEPMSTEATPPTAPTPSATTPADAATAPADAPTENRDAASSQGEMVLVSRDSLERAGIKAYGSTARITRPEFVYGPRSTHSFLRDNFLAATQGNSEAADRQRRHYGMLTEIATQMEREAAARMLDPKWEERAGDVLSSEIPGAIPTEFLPGLLTPRILKGRPMAGFYAHVPIANATPRTFAKVTTSTAVVAQTEGSAPTVTDFATTAVTVTPTTQSATTDVSRQVIDGADPAAEAMIFQDLYEAYSQRSEVVVVSAVEAGSTASGVAITAATPYAGAISNVVNFYGVRFRTAQRAFIPSAEFSTLLGQLDTTGRPVVPQIGPVNSDGSVNTDSEQIVAPILSAQGVLSWQSTVNVWVFARASDFVIYESPILQFSYEQVVGPQAIRVGVWAYLGVGTRLGSLKVTAA